MKRLLFRLVAVGLVCTSSGAWGACRSFGTQLDCTFGKRHVLIGTQTAPEPRRAGALRPLPLGADQPLLDERPRAGRSFDLEVQNVGNDPGLCWKLGNETYCH